MIDIKDLQAFLAILDSRSISRAAEQLGITQPALSLKLKKMESDLGVHLFQRTARAMVPLETCAPIEPIARDIVNRLESLKDAVAQRVEDLEGEVRLACLVGWTDALLVPLVQVLRERCPKVQLRLQIMETVPALMGCAAGHLDFAVVAEPFEEPDGVSCTQLLDEQLVLFARELPTTNDPGQLRASLLAMQWVTMTYRDLLVDQYWQTAFGEPFPWAETAPPLVIDHLFAVRSLVASLAGTVAALPLQVFQLKTEQTSPFDRRMIRPQRNGLHLAWRAGGLELRRFQVVKDAIVAVARDVLNTLPS